MDFLLKFSVNYAHPEITRIVYHKQLSADINMKNYR